MPAPWSSPSGGKEQECRFSASCALRFRGGSDTRRMTKGFPKAILGPEKKWFPWPGTPRRASAATGVLPELAWDSPCTGRTSPFRDSYREELNCNRLGPRFSEESLSYCKRGSGDARPGSSERVTARQALATPLQPAPAPGPPLKLQLQQPLRKGVGWVGSCPAPPPSRPSPAASLDLTAGAQFRH